MSVIKHTGIKSLLGEKIYSQQIELKGEYQVSQNVLKVNINGHQYCVTSSEHDGRISLYTPDRAISFEIAKPDLGNDNTAATSGALKAPMNGTMVTLLVEPGTEVKKDDALLVMEAMKMEHTIRAPEDGTINAFYFQPGELVDGDVELVDFISAE